MNQLVVTCPDENSTILVAQKMAKQLSGSEIIELSGDLGSGKTTFVKGLAKGLESKAEVSSPSFALKNVYEGRLKLYHFDLYRLEKPDLIGHELQEAIDEFGSVVAIEWAGISSKILPKKRIIIEFSVASADSRKLKVTYP